MSIQADFFQNWLSEDGLCRLSLDEKRPHLNGLGQETARNGNGILFLAYFLLLNPKPQYKGFVEKVIESLRRRPYEGLFDRWPMDSADRTKGPQEHERHDNYAAIAALSREFDLPYAKQILDYGKKHLWCYDNIEPKKFSFANWRQPGEVAFYYLCNRQLPGMVKTIWMIAGLVINSFKRGDPGQTNLAWLRLMVLNKYLLFKPIASFWKFMKGREYPKGIREPLEQYFTAAHPIVQLAKTLTEERKWSL